MIPTAVINRLTVETNLFKINQMIHLEMVRDISKYIRQMIALLVVLLVLVFVIFVISAVMLAIYLKRGSRKDNYEKLNGVS